MVNIIELIGALGNLATAIGVFVGFRHYKKDVQRNAQQATLDAYTSLQHSTFSKINQWSPSEIREAVKDKQSDAYKELSAYLAGIECFCVGISIGIYDFETFYQLSHHYFDSEMGLLKPRLLPILQAKLKNSKEDSFADLHKVWARMDKRTTSKNEK